MNSVTQIMHCIYVSALSMLSEHFYAAVKETGILSLKMRLRMKYPAVCFMIVFDLLATAMEHSSVWGFKSAVKVDSFPTKCDSS
jgi:hypothetical protein